MVNEPLTDGLSEEPLAVNDPKHWAAGVPGVAPIGLFASPDRPAQIIAHVDAHKSKAWV